MDNGRWTRLDNGGRPKLVDWLKLILPLLLVVSACCTNIQAQVQPNRFPKEVAPDSSNFETYSQKNGVNKRANLYDLKKYFTPRYIGQVAYVPGATGNALNRMEFIRAADGHVYYIDKDGKSVKFNSDGATIEQLSDSIAYVLNKVSRWDTSSTNELQTIYIVNHRLYISGVSQLGLSLSPYRDSIFIRSGVRDTLKTSTGYKVVLPLADGSETKVRVFDLLGLTGSGTTAAPYDIRVPGGTLSGSGGNGFVGFPVQSSAPGAPGSGFRMFSDASNRLSWIGSNGFVRTFEATGITANRVFKFQNKSYTLADSTDLASLQSTVSGLGSIYFPLPGGTLSGSGGNGFVGFPVQSSAPGAPGSGFRMFSDASNRLSWIGSNGFVRTFEATGITANRVFKFQNKSYTLADSANVASLQSTVSGLGSTYFPLPGGTLSGSGGNGFVGFPVQSSAPITPSSGFRIFSDASNRLSWIGSNGYVRTFEATGISANRVFKFQNKSYTLADSTDLASLQSTVSGLGSTYFPLPGGTLNGSGGNGFVGFPAQSSAPATPSSGFRIYADNLGKLSWIGTNGYSRTFDGTANTASRMYNLPNANGTLVLLDFAQTWTAAQTFTMPGSSGAGFTISSTTQSAINAPVMSESQISSLTGQSAGSWVFSSFNSRPYVHNGTSFQGVILGPQGGFASGEIAFGGTGNNLISSQFFKYSTSDNSLRLNSSGSNYLRFDNVQSSQQNGIYFFRSGAFGFFIGSEASSGNLVFYNASSGLGALVESFRITGTGAWSSVGNGVVPSIQFGATTSQKGTITTFRYAGSNSKVDALNFQTFDNVGSARWDRLIITTAVPGLPNSGTADVIVTNSNLVVREANLLVGTSVTSLNSVADIVSLTKGVRIFPVQSTAQVNYNTTPLISIGSLIGGSGYVSGNYSSLLVSNITGSGSGAIVNITVVAGIVTAVTVSSNGGGYAVGDILTVSNALIGGSGSGLQFTVTNTSVGAGLFFYNSSLNIPQFFNGSTIVSIASVIKTGSVSIDFPLMSSDSNASFSVTCTGAAVGDAVAFTYDVSNDAGVTYNARVSAANTILFTAINASSSSVNPAPMNVSFTVIK